MNPSTAPASPKVYKSQRCCLHSAGHCVLIRYLGENNGTAGAAIELHAQDMQQAIAVPAVPDVPPGAFVGCIDVAQHHIEHIKVYVVPRSLLIRGRQSDALSKIFLYKFIDDRFDLWAAYLLLSSGGVMSLIVPLRLPQRPRPFLLDDRAAVMLLEGQDAAIDGVDQRPPINDDEDADSGIYSAPEQFDDF